MLMIVFSIKLARLESKGVFFLREILHDLNKQLTMDDRTFVQPEFMEALKLARIALKLSHGLLLYLENGR